MADSTKSNPSGTPIAREPRAAGTQPTRSRPIAVAAAVFMGFGLLSALATVPLVAYVAYYRTAAILPPIGDVLDDHTPIGLMWGIDGVVALGIVLILVDVLDFVAGLWLWRSLRWGGSLGLLLQPVNLAFAYGFGVPILYILPWFWSILVVWGWRSLRPRPEAPTA